LPFGLFIAAIGYSFFRMVSKKTVCEKCDSQTLIPVDTPMGQKIVKELGHKAE
jgi:hypothetical protein